MRIANEIVRQGPYFLAVVCVILGLLIKVVICLVAISIGFFGAWIVEIRKEWRNNKKG